MVIGPDGQPVAIPADAVADDEGGGDSAERLTGLVEQPAKVMRIGRMVQQLLEEVKSAPLDEPGRKRLRHGAAHLDHRSSRTGWPRSSTTSSTG